MLRASGADPGLALTHRLVLMTATDVAGEGESAALLLALRVLVIRKPFDLQTAFTVVDDIIAR